jgi:hypothetical protein
MGRGAEKDLWAYAYVVAENDGLSILEGAPEVDHRVPSKLQLVRLEPAPRIDLRHRTEIHPGKAQ